MNLIVLSGRLGATPQLRFTANKRIPVTTLRLATKDKKDTTWHNITVWSEQAELCCKYLEKASKVVVKARIQYKTTCIDEKDIQIAEIVAEHVEFT